MNMTTPSALRRTACATCLWIIAACGHEVTVGRYPTDADVEDDAHAGMGGTGGTGGSGGSAGHDECAELEPVCGSNGMTYMNGCLALRAGVRIAHRGVCP